MLSHLNSAYWNLGEMANAYAAAQQIVPLIQQFPLEEVLWPAYHSVIDLYKARKDGTEALRWIEILRNKAEQAGDRISIAKAATLRAITLSEQGDFVHALPVLNAALERSRAVGEATFVYHCLHRLALNALFTGDIAGACHYTEELLSSFRDGEPMAPTQQAFCGYIFLATGQVDRAVSLLTAACEATAVPPPDCQYWLAQALIAAGSPAHARQRLEAFLAIPTAKQCVVPDFVELKPIHPAAVAALDRLTTDAGAFQRNCDEGSAKPDTSNAIDFARWYAIPAEPRIAVDARTAMPMTETDICRWQWHDPLGKGAYIATGDGNDFAVEVNAAAGRDLWFLNLSAPVLRCAVTGDFALRVRCWPSTQQSPTMGGLLLWHGPTDFVRLDWGSLGAGEVSCLGCSNGYEKFWGRGRTDCPMPYLHLERQGSLVRALFSDDGETWQMVGEIMPAVAETWSIGLYAVGIVDRLLYPAATAGGGIRFAQMMIKRLHTSDV